MKPGFMSMFSKSMVVQRWAYAKNLSIKPETDLENRNPYKVFFFSDLKISSVPLLCRRLVNKEQVSLSCRKNLFLLRNNEEHLHQRVTSTFV